MKIFAAGIGNVLKSDDGIGVYLCRYLKDKKIPGLDAGEIGTETWRILPAAGNAEKLIILDAVNLDRPAGTVCIAGDFETSGSGLTLHENGFLSELSLYGRLKGKPEIDFFGVVPESLEWGIGLSGTLKEKFNKIASRLEEFILGDQ